MSSSRTPEITKQDGVTILSLGPDFENLDERGLNDLKEVILEVANQAAPPLVVLDLSNTNFFGSAFIEILFRAWNRLNAREGGKFCISGLTPYCREVIEVTHLDRLWEICPTREEGVNRLLGR
jgi:anti-anti-sigma factor